MIKKLLIISLVLVTHTLVMPPVVYDPHYKEVRCLAEAIWQEARGESRTGQQAVAQVVINRTRDNRWPNTICKVVFQPRQFTWTAWWKDWQADRKTWELAYIILQTNKAIPGFTATHFHSVTVKPWWSKKLIKLGKIGNHVFYA